MKRMKLFLVLSTLFGVVLSGCSDNNSNPPVKKDFEEAIFEDASYVYDGLAHQLLEVSGIPSGTLVTYEGREAHSNVGEYPATAVLTKKGYNDKTLSATLTITPASFSNITFSNKTVDYNGQEQSITCSNVPSFATVTYQNNKGTDVGTYSATATISALNYNDLVLTATLTINKGTIRGVTFNDASYTYDGNEHSILIRGTLPAGVSVTYENNKRTIAGSQVATATISGSGYNTLVLNATLTINKAKFTGISFKDLTVEYDGETHEIIATGIPSFATVNYQNNSAIEAGTYNASVTISADNYESLTLTATLTISLRIITSITFDSQTFEYDGNSHSLAISGTLPNGTSVKYDDNSRSAVGTQIVTATISGVGYETLVLTANLTITPRKITGITFNNGVFDYDGIEHVILISGNLPGGVSATYTDNKRTEVGYQIASVTLSGEGYEDLTLTAKITIYDPADLSDTLYCSNEKNKFLNTDEYTSGTATLTTERGMDIEFAYQNVRGGKDNWLELNTGGYFYNTTPVDSFTDLSLDFSKGYEDFRVYYSYDEPVFDVSRSVDYEASYKGYKSTTVLEEHQPTYFMVENIDVEPIILESIEVELDLGIVNPILTVSSNNTNYGTVSGGGKYKSGDKVTVTAKAASSAYIFDAWYLDDKICSLQAEYTFKMPDHSIALEAKFVTKAQHNWDLAHGVRPTIDETNKVVTYGMYPKTHVAGQSLINNLNNIAEPEENGWYLYNDEYYAKVVATPNIWNTGYIPEFDDGVEIYSGETYWFKVEPIKWRLARKDAWNDNTLILVSDYLLDAQMFYHATQSRIIDEKTIYPNNYEYSDIRTWLNNDFYNKAFSLDGSCVSEAKIDNSLSTTNNNKGSYYCNTTYDKVYFLSYKEYTNFVYGFSNDKDRQAYTTDYSRAVGVSYMKDNDESEGYVKFTARYWTRSPDNDLLGNPSGVSSPQATGYIAGSLAYETVNDKNVAVRPAISLLVM